MMSAEGFADGSIDRRPSDDTDGVTSVVPGTSTTYTIVVRNAGPSTAVDQAVTDFFPSAITAVSWTAVASAGSSVAQASGSGNIATTVTLLPGGTAKIDYPFAEATVVPYDSEDTAFQDLALGTGKRLDAIVSNYLTAEERVEKNADKFKIVGDAVFGEPIWVAIDKGDPEWEAKIKEIFKAMHADGTLKALSEKWLGADITTPQS